MDDDETELPEWYSKTLLSIEQKIGELKNEITDKKKKKKLSMELEDLNKDIETLTVHKTKLSALEVMIKDEEF